MDGGGFWEHSWVFWLIFGFAMMGMFGGRSGWACGSPRSRRTHRSRSSEEITRLKAELDASHEQIAALKRRLEAVETIVTDEETALRREFDALQRG